MWQNVVAERSMKILQITLALCTPCAAQSRLPRKPVDPQLSNTRMADVQTRQDIPSLKPSVVHTATDTPAAPLTSAKYEYYTNVTIPSGQSVNLDSTIDYSSSGTISSTLRSAKSDIASLLGTAFFTVPNALEYVTQEAFLGSNFFSNNSGGATVQVCGPQFRLTLQNLGSNSMTPSSVLVYTHVQ